MDGVTLQSTALLQRVLPWLLVCPLVYALGVVAFRLFFHPLAKFPGSKLAASTKWYEMFYDVLKGPGGQFFHEVERMHNKYGTFLFEPYVSLYLPTHYYPRIHR